MVAAWGWSADDRIVLVLPLNHVHGIVNVTLCPLAVGACCEAPGGFDAVAVWERFASGEVTVFMAVPTIYARLVAAWEAADDADPRSAWSSGAAGLRLMVSRFGGAAGVDARALARADRPRPARALRHDRARHGAVEHARRSGCPATSASRSPASRCASSTTPAATSPRASPASCWCAGPQVFAEYWGRPEATAEAFTDGWFRTGDVAVHEPDGYRLLGRSSVDIIKTGGEKVSALEIEEVLRTHPAVADCAVVGLDDPEWGQRVAAAVVPAAGRGGSTPTRCGRGASSSWPRRRCRRGSCSSTTCPATPRQGRQADGRRAVLTRRAGLRSYGGGHVLHADHLRGRRPGRDHHAEPARAAQRLHRHDARGAARRRSTRPTPTTPCGP